MFKFYDIHLTPAIIQETMSIVYYLES